MADPIEKISHQKYFAMRQFENEENLWVDEVIRSAYPRFLTKFAERPNWFSKHVLSFILAYPFSIDRKKNTNVLMGKGFRAGHGVTQLVSIKSTVKRYKKSFAEREFKIGVNL